MRVKFVQPWQDNEIYSVNALVSNVGKRITFMQHPLAATVIAATVEPDKRRNVWDLDIDDVVWKPLADAIPKTDDGFSIWPGW